MEKLKKKYFDLSWAFLKNYIGLPYEEMIKRYQQYPEDCILEEKDDLVYFLFSYELVKGLERGILLVYDQDMIIADCSFMHGSMENVMKEKNIYDYITLESDWSNLEYYTLCNYMFDLPYPYCFSDKKESFEGEVSFFTNAYVTMDYRKQGIFSEMLDLSKEMIFRNTSQEIYYSIFSLDPDIPCYGPDTKDEPYYYSMKDEPTRLLNKRILESKGYIGIRLEDEEENDGSKLWYAVYKGKEQIIDLELI